jgi:hypothetical protein
MADQHWGPERLDALEADLDGWLAGQLDENPIVDAVERDEPGERRWFVRVRGTAKSVFTIVLHLDQRTLSYETYLMPAPEHQVAAVHELALRRNRELFGAAFAIGEEDAIFLEGRAPVGSLDEGEVDRILGTLYETVERSFLGMVRLGFPGRSGHTS